MSLNEHDIETVLRHAPRPKAPRDLKGKLLAQVMLPQVSVGSGRLALSRGMAGWLRRWWPALAPSAVSLACAAVVVGQAIELRHLRQDNARLAEQRAARQTAATPAASASHPTESAPEVAVAEQREIAQLKAKADELTAEVTRLESVQAENERLRKQPVIPGGLSLAELDGIKRARENAMSLTCVNNLKQIGLAARQSAMHNKGVYPRDFLTMSNELLTPKVLVCPADSGRQPATSFGAFTDANCSYELLAPGGSNHAANRVLTRCPIHGHIGLCDGSVQREVAKKHPEWLIQRDRKLFLEPNP